jgi:hypothetical protein
MCIGVGALTFDAVRNRPRCIIQAPHRLIHVSHDGKWIITHRATYDHEVGPICVWDSSNGKAVSSFLPEATYLRWAMSHDEVWLAAAPHSGDVVYLIDWQKQVATPIRIDGGFNTYQFVFSARNRWCAVLSGNRSGPSALIDVTKQRFIRRFPNPIRITADERFLLHVNELKQHIEIYGLPDLKKIADLGAMFSDIALSANGRWLATWLVTRDPNINEYWPSLRDEGATVWDLTTGQTHLRLDPMIRQRVVVFSGDGRRMATWSGSAGGMILCDLDNKTACKIPKSDSGIAQFTDSGDLLCDWDFTEKKVRMLDATTGRALWEMSNTVPGRYKGRAALILTPDFGLRVDSESTSSTVVDLRTGRSLRELVIGMLPSHVVTCSPNRKFIALSCESWAPPNALETRLRRWGAAPRTAVLAVSPDANECRVTFRLYHQEGGHPFNTFISNDGNILISHHLQIEIATDPSIRKPPSLTVHVWDIRPARAWIAAIAAAAAAVVALLLLGRGWRRIHSKRDCASA